MEQQIFKVISGQIDLDAMFSEGHKMKGKQVLNLLSSGSPHCDFIEYFSVKKIS